jgi:hypothetical protein
MGCTAALGTKQLNIYYEEERRGGGGVKIK